MSDPVEEAFSEGFSSADTAVDKLFAEGIDLLFGSKKVAGDFLEVRRESVLHWSRGSRPIPPEIWEKFRTFVAERIEALIQIEEATDGREGEIATLWQPRAEEITDSLHHLRLRAEAAEAELAALKAQMATAPKVFHSNGRISSA